MVHVYKNVFVMYGQKCFMAAAAAARLSWMLQTSERETEHVKNQHLYTLLLNAPSFS